MRVLALLLFLAPRQIGQLTLDGVPEIPKRIAERQNQYQNARSAIFLDWDPSGPGMLIATRFGETNQVHHLDGPMRDRRQLTFFPDPITEAAYLKKQGDKGFFFRMDAGGGEFYQYHWYDRATGRTRLVTDGKSRNEGLTPSNAGDAVALSSTQRNGKDFDLYVVRGDEMKRVKEVSGQWNVSDWSPDDKRLLIKHYVSINESYLEVLDLESGKSTPLNPSSEKIAYGAAAFARKTNGVYLISDEGSDFRRLRYLDLASGKQEVLTPSLNWDVDDLALSDDGAWIAWTVNEGGQSSLWLSPTKKLAPQKIALPMGIAGRLKFDRASKRLAVTLSTPASPSDIWTVDVKTRAITRWTESEIGGLPPSIFVQPERIELKAADGVAVSAFVYKPRATTKVPVILLIHGGPEAQSNVAFSSTLQYWVHELGAAVIVPNVRGSAGFGKKFLLLDNAAKREDSVRDIGVVLDWIDKQPALDGKRVAVYGGSYGGYMVLSSLFHYPKRIKCGIDMVGISNFVTFLEHTESYRRDLRRAEYGDERDPEMRKLLTAISPLTHASEIVQPLLVAQGKNDPRVPVTEAEQIVSTVRKGGKPVWYMVAADEGHGFQKKANRDVFTNAVSLFFEEYLLK